MIRIDIKPLSMNKAYLWKKIKSAAYRNYEKDMLEMLPNWHIWNSNLELYIKVWYSSRWSDIDNCLKPFIDILQKKYNFNDNRIYRLIVEKNIVKKWEEFIEFKLTDIVW